MKVKVFLLLVLFTAVLASGCNDDPFTDSLTEADFVFFDFAYTTSVTIDRMNQTIYAVAQDRQRMDSMWVAFRLANGAKAYVDGVLQVSGITVNDYSTGSVIYTVVSGDGKTTKQWEVTISKTPTTEQGQINDDITTNTILSGDITIGKTINIAANVSVRVESGTTLRCAKGVKIKFGKDCSFETKGTKEYPITFTSLNTNEFWGGIEVINSVNSVEFTYCNFENGGGNSEPFFKVDNAVVGVAYCNFSNIRDNTILLGNSGFFRTFNNNIINTNCSTEPNKYPIVCKNINNISSFGDNNSVPSKGIYVENTTITHSITIQNQLCPFIMSNDVEVGSASEDCTIFIYPGVNITMPSTKQIRFGHNDKKVKLIAKATEASPIVFTCSDQAAGSWRGMLLGSNMLQGTELSHCSFEYAGNSGLGTITCEGTEISKVTIMNCKIRNTNSHGIYFKKGADANLDNNDIQVPAEFNAVYYEQ